MELRLLRYFLAVAREENITAAAATLHITQPTLSKQLQVLEEECGKQLFTRGSRRISLTDEGRFFRNRAQEIVDLADKLDADLKDIGGTIGGDVYIGGGETAAMRTVAKVIKQITLEYPLVRFHLFSGHGNEILERLDKGLLDFGILFELVDPSLGVLTEHIDSSKYNSLELPNSDKWGLLMPKHDAYASKSIIKHENLKEMPLIVAQRPSIKFDEFQAKKAFSDIAGMNTEQLNVVATYNLIYNASLLVEEGVGYALCIDKLINTSGDSNLVFVPFETTLTVRLDIVWKKYQVFSPASKVFLERLRKEIAQNNM